MWQAKIWHSDASYTRRLSKIPPSTPFARSNIRSVVVRTGGREDGEGATVSPHTACVSSCTHTAIPVHVYMTVLHARRADSPGQRKTAARKHAQRGDHCSVSPVPRAPPKPAHVSASSRRTHRELARNSTLQIGLAEVDSVFFLPHELQPKTLGDNGSSLHAVQAGDFTQGVARGRAALHG